MKRFLWATFTVGGLLAICVSAASADPVTVSGTITLDSEQPGFISFDLSGSRDGVTFQALSGRNIFGGAVFLPSGLGFACDQACFPAGTFAFSNTTDGVQPLGLGGTLLVGGAAYSDVTFSGSLDFASPGAIIPPAPTDSGNFAQNNPILAAPFTFQGTLIGVEGGFPLFSAALAGSGLVQTRLMWNGADAFRVDPESTVLRYALTNTAPTPEPTPFLLVASGVLGIVARRRRAAV